MSFLDTLLIDGTNLRSIDGIRIVGQIDGLFSPGERRGEDDVVPGRDGELGAKLPLSKYVISVPIRVLGATRGQRNDILRSVGDLCQGDHGLVTLTRRIAKGSGSAFDQHTAPGRFIGGATFHIYNPYTGSTELRFYNLRGGWWNGSAWITP